MRLSRRAIYLLGGVAALGGCAYLLMGRWVLGIGFPLDDAWIHQTYARNLAQGEGWSFVRGQVSAGSTAPLWSLLLVGGHWLPGVFFYLWTYLLGWLALWATGMLAEIFARGLTPNWRSETPWVGLLVVCEWHLVWASVSGMETVLAALVLMAVLVAAQRERFGLGGALAGLGCWIRPDVVTMLGPLFFTLLLARRTWRVAGRSGLRALVGFGVFFMPYLAFNLWLAGEVWPNTFYAKQAEYAVLLARPFLLRFVQLLSLPLVGAGILLLPGAIYCTWCAVRERSVVRLGAILWWFGYSALYALRLAVVYQHGRYLMPAMPVFWVMGMVGTMELVKRLPWVQKWRRRAALFAGLSIGLVAAAFWGLGAWSYAQDVAIIETEMVTAARWVNENTPEDALIAAHDIGAVGYFGDRRLVDLAGLVSPEVIPFIRDEDRLAAYLIAVDADYLLSFPGWYPQLMRDCNVVFESDGSFALAQGGENMVICRLKE